jgi:hypothetical protein
MPEIASLTIEEIQRGRSSSAALAPSSGTGDLITRRKVAHIDAERRPHSRSAGL